MRAGRWLSVSQLTTWSYTGSSLALETGRTGSPRCKGEGRIPNRRLTVLAPDGTGREAPLCAAGWFALLTSCYLCNWSSRRRCLIKPIQALIQSFFQPPSPAGRQPWRHEPDGGGRACPQAPLCGGCTSRQEAPVTQAPCPLASGSAGTGCYFGSLRVGWQVGWIGTCWTDAFADSSQELGESKHPYDCD